MILISIVDMISQNIKIGSPKSETGNYTTLDSFPLSELVNFVDNFLHPFYPSDNNGKAQSATTKSW
jgi:hypothetical protein